ncbi:tyrosine-type recombinase/integrase [Pseudooceanicola nitratireducens]|uniref:tyrosine-type recombinase/integrase n=1 Tax=Pseudooceanicola nitratireducens TaxID=517719 RepID=UPI001C94F4A4|nr:tyrosine-type recombinase/integrase [Pseudooceanicola nitratireducens]MBY6157253.1 tyrosine-type recombinase/integrase [Pseudooceanicola nitratireducens]
MALLMKLPNVVTNKGKLVYSRRIPTDIKHLYPSFKVPFFSCRTRVQQLCAALVAEHAALEAAFKRLVADARDGVPEAMGDSGLELYKQKAWSSIDDPRTEREKWDEMRKEAEALVLSVRGTFPEHIEDGGDDARRQIVAEDIERRRGNPMLYRAVTQPNTAPPFTLADAARVYERERIGTSASRSTRNTFKKVKRRLEASLGPLDSLPLSALTREDARRVRDDLLAAPKANGGGVLSPASVERELNSIKAMITLGITEFDLRGQAFNPFEKLSLPASVVRTAHSEWEERDPLPDDVLIAVRHRVMTRVRIPELRLIWRLLQATGCRGAEITGLQIEDVVLDHDTPHLWVRWNDERQLKTKTSVRPVPLVGDGLAAAKEALKAAREGRHNVPALFPRYARDGGPDAVSSALMAHLRNETKNKRHVVYSLRHNVKSWLGQSGASERDENRLLGHAEASVGNRYYGGLDDRLRGTTAALQDALALAPAGAWGIS